MTELPTVTIGGGLPLRARKPDPDLALISGRANIAQALGIGEDRVGQAMADGLPVFRMGNADVVRRASLLAWLAERERAAVAERKGNAQ